MKIKQNIKKSIVGIMVIFCLLLIYYFHVIVKTEIVFTHLFYIPIVISALWWKRTAIFIAVLLGIALIISHFFMSQGFVLADILRALMFIFIASMVNYLTEKNKEYLSKIKESETKYKTIADYNYDWEFWLSPDKVFIYNSPSCERITGYKPIDFFNNPNLMTEIICSEDLSIYINHLDISSEDPTCQEIDYRIVTSLGEIRWISHICQPVFDESGNRIGRRGCNRDITSRKNAENSIKELNKELIKLNLDKDRFISILGHDLKNPFNNILGSSEVLIEDIRNLNTEEIEAQQGKIPFNPQLLSFAEICKNAIDVLKPNADAKNITINYSSTDHINVFADSDMLKTILRNLVSNAIKFTNNRGSINIGAEENSENVTISVSDNGIGIAHDELKKLFNISEVLTTKGTAGETGTGLGLLLCKEFVEKHGGKIWVKSEEGKGSDFKFTLPFSAEHAKWHI